MDTPQRFRRGDTSPDKPGLVFWTYQRGAERWVTREERDRRTKKMAEYQAKCRLKPETKAREATYNATPKAKEIIRRSQAKHRALNRAKINERQRTSPTAIAARKAYWKRWIKSPGYTEVRRAISARWRNTTNGKIINSVRSRIHAALRRGGTKSASTLELIGCSFADYRAHLERQFRDGMTWENYGAFWEIDHIRPLASFDLHDPDQQLAAFNFQNTQPLTVIENRVKRDKIIPLAA